MQCDQFETTLNDILDQRLNPGDCPALRGHAEKCHSCCEVLQGYLALVEHFSPQIAPPVDLADQVMESLGSAVPRTNKKHGLFDKILWAGVVSAAVLFAATMIEFGDNPTGVANKKSATQKKQSALVKDNGKKRNSSAPQMAQLNGRSSVSESLLLPPVIHIWSHRREYNEWINKTLDSVKKLNDAKPNRPQTNASRQSRNCL